MAISSNILENLENQKAPLRMDTWTWCPWCGVRQWFKHLYDNKYRCSHCKKDLEIGL